MNGRCSPHSRSRSGNNSASYAWISGVPRRRSLAPMVPEADGRPRRRRSARSFGRCVSETR